MPLGLIDLFAGCGGMTRGFLQAADFDIRLAVEMDPDAAATYGANFGREHLHIGRIEDVAQFPAADVVIGGPPCQGFSTLNRDGVGLERRALWMQYLRALDESQPQVWVMENVPQLLKSEEYRQFEWEVGRRGYQVRAEVLNAADYGVPQKRKRAIIIGSRVGTPPWPTQTHSSPDRPQVATDPWRTFREATAGLSSQPDGRLWHNDRRPRETSVERYRRVPADGGNRFDMQRNLDDEGLGHLVPRCWRNKPTGTTDVFGRLWWDRPATTIRTEFFKPEKGRYLHPSEDRAITVREAARCMSFDDGFVLPSQQSMTSVARQIGNAVPPRLAAAIASAIQQELIGEQRDAAALTAAA